MGRGTRTNTSDPAHRAGIRSASADRFTHPLVRADSDQWRDYYRATQAKHFGPSAVGSRFTAPGETLSSVLDRADRLRGPLDPGLPLEAQDDKDLFRATGVPEGALRADNAYLKVEQTPGLLGMVAASTLTPDTQVTLREVKPGILAFTTAAARPEPVNYATVVVARDHDDPATLRLITMFPGPPTDPDASMALTCERDGTPTAWAGVLTDGQQLTVSELGRIVGRDDLLLQTT